MRYIGLCLLYLGLCVLQPICLPLPEPATLLFGAKMIGDVQAFFIGVFGTVTGISIMFFLSRCGCKKLLSRFRISEKLQVYQDYTREKAVLITGLLFIIPILPDEVICIGAGILKMSYKKLLCVAGLSKIVSVSMICFSDAIARTVCLSQVEIIIIEIALLFLGSYVMKQREKENGL